VSAYRHTAYRNDLSPEERAAYVERVRAMFGEKRQRGEPGRPPTPDETLAELEQDQSAGRTLKHDYRCSPEEKARMHEAAAAMGLTVSEFVRAAVERACDEVLAPDPVP
jgi:DNA invertase Pin-like site-specific DNA recombinase